jgi:hypothetical protein
MNVPSNFSRHGRWATFGFLWIFWKCREEGIASLHRYYNIIDDWNLENIKITRSEVL